MNALYIMIPMAMAIAGFALVIFLYALKSGQFEDIEAPKYRMLFDEEDSHPIKQNKDN